MNEKTQRAQNEAKNIGFFLYLKGVSACRFKEQPFPKDLPLMPTFPVKQGEGSHHHKVKHNQPSPRKAAKAVPAEAGLFQPKSRSR